VAWHGIPLDFRFMFVYSRVIVARTMTTPPSTSSPHSTRIGHSAGQSGSESGTDSSGWPVIARGEDALILAHTGTGKTLAALLLCLDRHVLHSVPTGGRRGRRIVYVSPLKALAVDVERNLRSPLAGIPNVARRNDVKFHEPDISVRTGDTSSRERPSADSA
jgi:superfamily II DNA/RNA helicase